PLGETENDRRDGDRLVQMSPHTIEVNGALWRAGRRPFDKAQGRPEPRRRTRRSAQGQGAPSRMPAQNSSFKPSWLIRAGRADVTTPKLADAMLVATP